MICDVVRRAVGNVAHGRLSTTNPVEAFHKLALIGAKGQKMGFQQGLVVLGDWVEMFSKIDEVSVGKLMCIHHILFYVCVQLTRLFSLGGYTSRPKLAKPKQHSNSNHKHSHSTDKEDADITPAPKILKTVPSRYTNDGAPPCGGTGGKGSCVKVTKVLVLGESDNEEVY